jgi:hypothetical protein
MPEDNRTATTDFSSPLGTRPNESQDEFLARWTQVAVPAIESLGIRSLVMPWREGGKAAFQSAIVSGYRVYVMVDTHSAVTALRACTDVSVCGIALDLDGSQSERAVSDVINQLKSIKHDIDILVLNKHGKWPQMLGNIVLTRDGVLQASSPTRQPWIDSNAARVRMNDALGRLQATTLAYKWEPVDPLDREGPRREDYLLSIAESGALRCNLVIDVHERVQVGLLSAERRTLALWREIRSYLEFYRREKWRRFKLLANVGVVATDYSHGGELINLLGRHNIPFRVLLPLELAKPETQLFDVIIVIDSLDQQMLQRVAEFARSGVIAIFLNLKLPHPWQGRRPDSRDVHRAAYDTGAGKVILLLEEVLDPDQFARDVNRLLGSRRRLIELWNGLTVLSTVYQDRQNSSVIVELLNFSGAPLSVQMRVKGTFSQVKYEVPEQSGHESLKTEILDGFTQFVIPWIHIGGRLFIER